MAHLFFQAPVYEVAWGHFLAVLDANNTVRVAPADNGSPADLG